MVTTGKAPFTELSLDERLRPLIDVDDGPCISMYMPMEERGAQTRQNRLNMKNALREARAGLEERGTTAAQATALLEAPASLVNDDEFWQHQRRGLAVFASPALAGWLRLADRPDRLVSIGDFFTARPLLPGLARRFRFYLIALSQGGVRLFDGTPDELIEIDISAWPRSLRELDPFIDTEKSVQFHTAGGPGGTGDRRAVLFHGQGADQDDAKTRIAEFFNLLDEGLREVLREPRRPLLVAGVDRVVTIFRRSTSHPEVVEPAIPGNPDHMNRAQLLDAAGPVIEQMIEERRRQGRGRFGEVEGSELATRDADLIVRAAGRGQVELILLRDGASLPGAPPGGEVGERCDLLEYAAVMTLRTSGRVFVHDAADMPGESDAVAVLRPGARA